MLEIHCIKNDICLDLGLIQMSLLYEKMYLKGRSQIIKDEVILRGRTKLEKQLALIKTFFFSDSIRYFADTFAG